MLPVEEARPESPIEPCHVIGLVWKACRDGTLASAKWVADEFGLTDVDARAFDNRTLRWACAAGHLHVAAWLVEKFDLCNPEDGRVRDNEILRTACADGSLDVAMWVVETYQLVEDDARTGGNAPLRHACASGDAALVEFLLGTFRMCRQDVVEADGVAHAYLAGHAGLARNLAATFGLDDPTGAPGEGAPGEPAEPVEAAAWTVVHAQHKFGPSVAPRVVPGLCRAAMEAEFERRVWTTQLAEKKTHAEISDLLEAKQSLYDLAQLALTGGDTRDLYGYLSNKIDSAAVDTFKAVRDGAHGNFQGDVRGLVDRTQKMLVALGASI
jgi:hypothetical protein